MYNKILLAIDGSACAEKAAVYVRDLIKLKPNVMATVLYVKNYNREYHMNRGISVELPVDEATITRDIQENVLNRAASIFTEGGVQVETKILFGNAPEEICALAERDGYDLIVMGSRGLSEIGGFFLGSVSDRVLHLAHCSVLIVK